MSRLGSGHDDRYYTYPDPATGQPQSYLRGTGPLEGPEVRLAALELADKVREVDARLDRFRSGTISIDDYYSGR